MAQQLEQPREQEKKALLVSTFFLGDTLLGIDTLRVQEIVRVTDITKVHHAPDYVLGIINLRGKIVTILDLGRKLNLSASLLTPASRIIILDWNGEYAGFLVDTVSDVIGVERDNISHPPTNIGRTQERFFEGVYQSNRHLLSILNVEEVLSVQADEK